MASLHTGNSKKACIFLYEKEAQPKQEYSTEDVYSYNIQVGILTTLATDGSSVIQATPVL